MGTAHATNPAGGGVTDHGALTGLSDDDHTIYALLAGRAGGQILNGGTAAADNLTLRANSTLSGAGRIRAEQGMVIDRALERGAAASMVMSDTYTQSTGFVGGGIQSLGTVTYANSTWIWALVQESKGYIANVGPGFAAFTLFNAIPFIRNGTSAALVQALVLNVGVAHQSVGAVASTVSQTIGVSFSANTRTFNAGGTMTKTTGDIGFSFGPTHGTVLGSTVNHGTLIGFRCLNPTVPLFQSGAGVETMTAYIGMEINAIPFGGNVTKRGVRSFLAAASNTRFLDGQGTAESDLRGSLNFVGDLIGVRFGLSQDWQEGWGASGFKFEQQLTGAGGQFRKSFPAAGRMLMDWSANMELNINTVLGFSLGAQTGANGNQFGNFVTAARTIGVSGEWADFLLTQGGSLTVDGNNMSRVSAWVINGISYANSTGTVTNADTLTIGGFPTSSPGVTIDNRHSLNVIAGRSRFASAMQKVPITPAALGAGDNDDWAGLLTGSANNGMRPWARITGNATTSVITGIDSTAAQDGDTFTLTNVGTETILIGHQDTGSSASNRIICPNDTSFVLTEAESCEVAWDETTDRWRVLTTPRNAAFALTGEWQFDNTTTMADPGNGNFRNNNGTLASVTALAISDESKPGVDLSTILSVIGNGDRLYVQNKEDGSQFMVFDVTGTTDNTSWWQINGTVAQSGNAFTDGKEFIVTVIFA